MTTHLPIGNLQSPLSLKQLALECNTLASSGNLSVVIIGYALFIPHLLLPHSVNCWPSENGGKCDVNIEYELMQDYLELQDTVVTIPIP